MDTLRIAPVALGEGLGSLSLNPTTKSLLQGLQRPQLPITDREPHWRYFAVRFPMFHQDIKNITETAMSDAVRLQYLEQSLDPTNRARIWDKGERGIGVSFNDE